MNEAYNKTRFILLLCLIAFAAQLAAQKVDNVLFFPQGSNKVAIYYNLAGTAEHNSFLIELYISEKCDGNFTRVRSGLQGEIGYNITPGNDKYIVWQPAKDLHYKNCCFKVRAVYEVQTKTTETSKGGNTNTNKQNTNAFVHKKEYTETTTGMKYIAIQGGTFEMGSNEYYDEKPIHTVKLDNFYMSKYEVTNEQVCMFLNEMGNKEEGGTTWLEIESSYCKIEKKNDKFVPKAGYEKHPVVEFSWYGATAYAKWLSQKTGQTWRLPTEAEWEYAAKGGENYKYAGSDNIDEVAWYSGNSERKTHQVGTRKANGYGLYDMSGNVWEWCSDWYDKNYYQKLKDSEEYKNNGFVLNPVCTDKTSGYRVLRGGSWISYTNDCRVAYRGRNDPYVRVNYVGFRVCSSAL